MHLLGCRASVCSFTLLLHAAAGLPCNAGGASETRHPTSYVKYVNSEAALLPNGGCRSFPLFTYTAWLRRAGRHGHAAHKGAAVAALSRLHVVMFGARRVRHTIMSALRAADGCGADPAPQIMEHGRCSGVLRITDGSRGICYIHVLRSNRCHTRSREGCHS